MARREGFAVEREHGCPDDGVTMRAARRIRVLPALDGQQAAWALAHQLGHMLLHERAGYLPGTTTSGCTGVHKAEAEPMGAGKGFRLRAATVGHHEVPGDSGPDHRLQMPVKLRRCPQQPTWNPSGHVP